MTAIIGLSSNAESGQLQGDRREKAMNQATNDSVRFERLYGQNRDAIVSYCMRRIGRDEAMDVVASTFAVAWRRIDDVPHGEAELSWLYAVAYRMLANQRRSGSRFDALKAKLVTTERQTMPDPANQVVRHEDYQRLIDALGTLKGTDQEILRLLTWEEHPRDEIAAMFRVSRSTLDQRIHRATQRLRKAYDKTDSSQFSPKAAIEGGMQ
ncbi:MAG: sigma-70 family RNA polymerase sigma factor [Actinomycetia bacterium]|nr:sigma-70 family RNA polymerase sigma factor [Actinomycetes bacterium]